MRRYKRLRRRTPRLTPYQQLRIRHAQRLQQIIEAVSRASGIDVPTLRSHYVSRVYVDPRYVIMRIARAEHIPLSQMGRALGGRDHTTIISGLRRSDDLILLDPLRGGRILAIEAEATRLLAGIEPPELPKAEPVAESPPPPAPLPPPQRRHGTVDRFGQIICNP